MMNWNLNEEPVVADGSSKHYGRGITLEFVPPEYDVIEAIQIRPGDIIWNPVRGHWDHVMETHTFHRGSGEESWINIALPYQDETFAGSTPLYRIKIRGHYRRV